jgi:hypothetical protein
MLSILKFVAPKLGWRVYASGVTTIIFRKLG